ncbi:MAG TPA: glutathione peroxidase [Candidatus Cloacimonadota bacterium]|nr:glutathione peroxidase [Candidatus Cloacimonadota bacterium]HPT70794.1 glutathione peroxidase [Candidatus Cloacimonadota bacterium]
METTQSIYQFTVKDIYGFDKSLDEYKGKVLLIVNTASKCGYTPQYGGLQQLYDRYQDKGFVILGFPANNFLHQEPGNNEEILHFCQVNYHVTFPMFWKISVKGKDIHPLYKYLTSKETNPKFNGTITWNFNKFLISREGKIINRFKTPVKPLDKVVIDAIEEALS